MVADEFVAFSRLEGVEGSPVGQHEFVGVTVHTDPIRLAGRQNVARELQKSGIDVVG